MIGLLLASHGTMASGMYEAAGMILGRQPAVAVISVDRGMDPGQIRERYRVALTELHRESDGVLIMTDMFGGTPSNIGAEFLVPGTVELLAGVNLPMLLKFFSSRLNMQLDELTRLLKQYGSQGIVDVGDLLKQ